MRDKMENIVETTDSNADDSFDELTSYLYEYRRADGTLVRRYHPCASISTAQRSNSYDARVKGNREEASDIGGDMQESGDEQRRAKEGGGGVGESHKNG